MGDRYRKRPTEVNAIRVQTILDAQGSHPQALPDRIAKGEDVGLPAWLLPALVPDPETDEGLGG